MKNVKILLAILVIAGCYDLSFAQSDLKLEGRISDLETSRPLPGASIYIENLSRASIADQQGYYSLALPPGNYTIVFSFIGYESILRDVVLDKPYNLDVTLKPLATTMEEVIISVNHAADKITETETGLITLTQKDLETMPYLLGEADPVRIIQLMPGIQTAGEGNTGFYVRGGAVDQNLILLDNSIVYNPSHLFGFFSVFNGSTINSVDLYKGGIPAHYGGRLSSITKINTRKGDYEQFRGEASLGLIAGNVLVEGPIKKDKGSFLVAARRTYVDLFINPLRELFSVKEKLNYHFYDFNINADYTISPRDHLRFRTFSGKDDFEFSTGSSFSNSIKWGNQTTSLQWVHQFGDHLIGEFSINAVSYNMDFGAGINQYSFSMLSDIHDKGFSYQMDWKKKGHNVSFGLNYTDHTVTPNNVDAHSADVVLNFNNQIKLHAIEGAFFLNDKITLSDKLELNAGVRLTGYSQLGPFTRYLQDDNFQILDTIGYAKNERIESYYNAEPRVALRYSVGRFSSVKMSYDKAFQYMHMAPLSSASLPMDMWVTSSAIVKPQSAHQYAAGYFHNFLENTIETSLILYHKNMRNQLEYRDGMIIGYSKGFNYDDDFVFGKGTSSGVEFLVRKNSGRLNGMFAYTLSRTTRKFRDLNQGKAFPAKYDRLHDLSIMTNYTHNPKWTFSGVFVYGTGNALNLPIARYVIQGNVINEYGTRNSLRMPSYHRMDLAVTFVARKTEVFESQWVFSVYNVYNRRNPYYIYFETKGDLQEYKLETNLKQVSLFPVLPSVAYRVKF